MLADRPSGRLTGLRVLVVEDHEDTRLMLEQCLAVEGATVVAVSTAPRAVNVLAEREFDAIITDYSMPEGTGAWLLERVRQLRQPPPVIVLTGYMERDIVELRRAPFARVLRKPVETEALCDEILAVLRETRSQ